MRKVELTLFPAEQYIHVTQMGQFINVSFAFVDSEYKEIMQQVKCKDFMNVPNWQRKSGDVERVYGWTYDFKKTPYDVDVTRISMNFNKQKHADNFVSNIKHLNELEIKYGITPTEIITTQDPKIFVVEGDKVWQSNCWKMSMFMMYLRRMGHDDWNKPDEGSSDWYFLAEFNRYPYAEHNMLTNIFINYDSMENEYSIGTAHSSSGVMNILTYLRYMDPTTLKLSVKFEGMISPRQATRLLIASMPNPDFKLKEAA